jgi:uracil-DNA glycosylase
MTQPPCSSLAQVFPHGQWPSELSREFDEGYMQELCRYVEGERATEVVYPDPDDVFRAFQYTPFKRVRVVIVGQDPYAGHGQAMGLAFSYEGSRPHPLSLRNIMHAVQTDTSGLIAPAMSGDLTRWAEEENILLLNRTLTVRKDERGSHRGKGWETFTQKVIEFLNGRTQPIVFLLWGRDARTAKRFITGTQHHVLEAAHPADRKDRFFNYHPFLETNVLLQKRRLAAIDWSY